jgi:pentatricopeptide repeat protein
LNLLLLTCVQTKQPERAMERLHEARTFQERRPAKTEEDSQDNEPIVDVVSYNTVIKGFAQSGMLPRCFDCLHEMRSYNLEPDDVTFGTLLDMCIAGNDMNAANEVVDLLVRGDRPVDTVMCTLFIKGLVRAQKLPKAVELYEEMKRRNSEGTRPDIVTYSVLIKAFVDSHDLERALLLVEDMTAAGHVPDDIILTHLLEGCRYVGNHALGKRLFADMLAAGVKPSDFTLITMVKLHGRCGAHDEAYNLVASWEKQHGLKPSVIHYTCLMSGCLRTKNYDQAWQAYRLMVETKVQPDETTMATLIPGMLAAQQWDRVITLVKDALKGPTPIPVAAETLNSALTQMRAASGQGLQAMQLQTMMQEANIRVIPRNTRRPS